MPGNYYFCALAKLNPAWRQGSMPARTRRFGTGEDRIGVLKTEIRYNTGPVVQWIE
jgi:hypothetical protein